MKTPAFNLSAARDAVQRFRWWQRFASLRHAIVPITAHLGSVAAIFTVYFFRAGSFAFDVRSWTDWLISVVLVLIVASGLYFTILELRRSRAITIKRSLLANLVAIARVDAEVSAETLAGDLSWLEEEAAALRSAKQARPTLSISVFYDRDRVPPDLLPRISELEDAGIELIPYPQKMVPRVRCLVIDRTIPDSTRAYMYSRCHSEEPALARSQHQFELYESGPNDTMVTSALCSIIEILRTPMKRTLRVGISGVNNVGKTTFATRLRSALQDRFTVDLIPDHFRTIGNGTDLGSNFRILFEQLADDRSSADVCIFDRTLIDNLCFLRMRNPRDESLYHALAPVVASASRILDLTFDIRGPAGSHVRRTKYLTSAERRFVREALDEFFEAYGVNRLSVEIDPGHFDASISIAVASAVGQIERLLRSRKVAHS